MKLLSFLCFALVGSAFMAGAVANEPLVWEAPSQNYTLKPGEVAAHFSFQVTNVSPSEVVIDDVKASCGCTVAKLPGKPWRIEPGKTSSMDVLVDVRGKHGLLFKEISVLSSNAPRELTMMINIPESVTNGMNPALADRLWGQQLAAADRQAVFKKECVNCHLTPAFGKSGQALYAAVCGICHEAKHRAAMVPDLRGLKGEIDSNYWRNIVANGKPGTLMPAFESRQGGPLSNAQINSLVDYLSKAFPRPVKIAAQAANGSRQN